MNDSPIGVAEELELDVANGSSVGDADGPVESVLSKVAVGLNTTLALFTWRSNPRLLSCGPDMLLIFF